MPLIGRKNLPSSTVKYLCSRLMIQNILGSMHTKFGRIIISVLLGLGLASIFRRSCKNHRCLVFKAPKINALTEGIYKHGEKCFSYKTTSVPCNSAKYDIIDVD